MFGWVRSLLEKAFSVGPSEVLESDDGNGSSEIEAILTEIREISSMPLNPDETPVFGDKSKTSFLAEEELYGNPRDIFSEENCPFNIRSCDTCDLCAEGGRFQNVIRMRPRPLSRSKKFSIRPH